MSKDFLFILLLISTGLLGACRGQRTVATTATQQHSSELGVEFHELERFWNSMAERLAYKIEFYPAIEGSATSQPDNLVPIDPKVAPGTSVLPPIASGGIGPVKSIDFSSERVAADSSVAKTDSVADSKSEEASDAHTEKASELRQDNGTVATVCIVFAVAALIYLCIRQFVKK